MDQDPWGRETDRTAMHGPHAGQQDDPAPPPALTWETVQQRLWEDPFRCANLECCEALNRDHVTLITTTHVRRFCSVDCVGAGQRANTLALWQHARLHNDLTFEAMERGDEPSQENLRALEAEATLWQRALSLHRHRCEPQRVPADQQPARDEDALADAARRCGACMADARQGLGFSVL